MATELLGIGQSIEVYQRLLLEALIAQAHFYDQLISQIGEKGHQSMEYISLCERASYYSNAALDFERQINGRETMLNYTDDLNPPPPPVISKNGSRITARHIQGRSLV